MSVELVSILVLVGIFLVATVRPVNLGVLAIVAAFVLGLSVLDGADAEEKTDAIFAGFPGDLFVILVGVTLLFAIAKSNGTVDWLVHGAIRAVGGRIGLIPWVMFLVTACLTAIGAVVPAAVAIIAPIGMGFAVRYRINPLLMGLLIINGASAGGFSPMSIFGGITNGVVEKADLPGNPTLLFLASFVFNLALSLVVYFLWGGRELLGRRAESDAEPDAEPGADSAGGGSAGLPAPASPPATGRAGGGTATVAPTAPAAPGVTPAPALDRDRILTLTGLLCLAVGALFFDLNVGMVAITVAAVLTLVSPAAAKSGVADVAWPTVLLVCGIVLYVSLMETIGTIEWLGEEVTSIGAPLLAALVICLIGGAVSAFASTTGILGALIPLAVPFLTGVDAVGAVGLITALAISSSVVDSSPFSTSGALTVANATDETRDEVYKGLMRWGFSMVLITPVTTWLVLVVPGWL
ncbi:SLC13 family permease [Streptomyces sp. WMMC500]|uniref:SLC13 family permease n=1 Tax=Streptomyces sp. WMMC500 TaxID=3015154 RepID=UPI00248CC4F1|nr:SLC13 family permease [Streptomyces sp. WMMC500]WBB57827.1 SLC13 family permease [Streptomyces sp. WMMC500]